MIRRWLLLPLLAALIVAAAPSYGAGDSQFRNGRLCGRVIDADTGKPIAGATVAFKDKDGKVFAWTITDDNGQYTAAADTLRQLDLEKKGPLWAIQNGVAAVAWFPIQVATTAVNVTKSVVTTTINNAVSTAKAGVVSAASGNPGPLAVQIAGTTLKGFAQGLQGQTKQEVGQEFADQREASARVALGAPPDPTKDSTPKMMPGTVAVSVSATHYVTDNDQAGCFWLAPPIRDSVQDVGPTGWIETVQLAQPGSKKKSGIVHESVLLANPFVDNVAVTPGSTAHIEVTLQAPEGPTLGVRIFARENRTHHVVELLPQGNNVYAGNMVFSRHLKPGDSTIVIAALHADPLGVTLQQGAEDPLVQFVSHLSNLNAGKSYKFDLRVMGSENRIDIPILILDPKKMTKPDAGTTTLVSAPAAGAQGVSASMNDVPLNPESPNVPTPAAEKHEAPANPPAPPSSQPAAPAGSPAPPTPPAPPTAPPAKLTGAQTAGDVQH